MNIYFCDFCGRPMKRIPYRIEVYERLLSGEEKVETEYYICSDCRSSMADKKIDVERKLDRDYKNRISEG